MFWVCVHMILWHGMREIFIIDNPYYCLLWLLVYEDIIVEESDVRVRHLGLPYYFAKRAT